MDAGYELQKHLQIGSTLFKRLEAFHYSTSLHCTMCYLFPDTTTTLCTYSVVGLLHTTQYAIDILVAIATSTLDPTRHLDFSSLHGEGTPAAERDPLSEIVARSLRGYVLRTC